MHFLIREKMVIWYLEKIAIFDRKLSTGLGQTRRVDEDHVESHLSIESPYRPESWAHCGVRFELEVSFFREFRTCHVTSLSQENNPPTYFKTIKRNQTFEIFRNILIETGHYANSGFREKGSNFKKIMSQKIIKVLPIFAV